MKVTIAGGWEDDSDDSGWGAGVEPAQRETFMHACRQLGEQLAARGHTIVVGSAATHRADFHLVQGFLAAAGRHRRSGPRVEVIDGIAGEKGRPYDEERQALETYDLFITHREQLAANAPRAAEKIVATRAADALLAIGGRTDTYIAGIGALMANKVVIPIATFGGAGLALHRAAQLLWKPGVTGAVTDGAYFQRLADPVWSPAVIDAVLQFGGLNRPRVFLASSGEESAKAIAQGIKEFLERLGCDVIFWSEDFRPGQVILDEIRAAAFACKYAVILLTPDDRLAGEPPRWLPRGNVVFELGHFLNALGTDRTVVIHQKGAEVPADYGGYIFASFTGLADLVDVHESLRKKLLQDLPSATSRRASTEETEQGSS
jgi:hypothetical protein